MPHNFVNTCLFYTSRIIFSVNIDRALDWTLHPNFFWERIPPLPRYLNYYELTLLRPYIETLKAADFSEVNAFFIASVPNSHKGPDLGRRRRGAETCKRDCDPQFFKSLTDANKSWENKFYQNNLFDFTSTYSERICSGIRSRYYSNSYVRVFL